MMASTWGRVVLLSALVWGTLALAQEAPAAGEHPAGEGGASEQKLSKDVQNPVANLISVPLQNNTDLGIGPFDRQRNTLNIQPVVPMPLTLDWNLITRVILPIVYQPDTAAELGGTFGLGDTSVTFFVAPKKPGKLIWGVGPALLLPTATDDVLGTGKWSAGPSVVLLVQPGPWTLGVLANNLWSVFGSGDRASVNQLLLQYFITYDLPEGWYVNSAPILTANWEAEAGQEWVVPFGGGGGKVFKVGGQALNGSVGAYYNAVRPDGGAKWQIRVQLAFLFPEGKKQQHE
ncbi:neuromedin U [Pyxidicoccus parkwayensis]|uniref:Neuromedin U n=1 Tax=Pyxidicoccus parkwayensis TaxID=2813578 RepID=A0ABX7P4J5_9BACT|nr:neuromedin U [Pyxidicoccus parkwaysis]QSQ25361.1 neuromedin U [Pyxidicoccus parkwaysis]